MSLTLTNPELRARLTRLLDQRAGQPDAWIALDFDNTSICGDIGELAHAHLSLNGLYAFDADEFWDNIDPADGRDRIRRKFDLLRPEHIGNADSQEWLRFISDFASIFNRRYRRAGPADTFQWAPSLHVGMQVEVLEDFAQQLAAKHEELPFRYDYLFSEFGERYRIPHGLRRRSGIQWLVDLAHERDIDVWVISATNQWTVQSYATHLGVPTNRIIGNARGVEGGRVTNEVVSPTTYRAGKVEAWKRFHERPPILAAGDSWTDYELLRSASDLALLFDRGDASLRAAVSDIEHVLLSPPDQTVTAS